MWRGTVGAVKPERLHLRAVAEIVIAGDVETATGVWKRFLGLMGRDSLPAGSALLLRPCGSIHMFFMRFPIDAVFLDRESRILKIHHAIRPWRMTLPVRHARSCVELPAGTATHHKLAVGEPLILGQLAATTPS